MVRLPRFELGTSTLSVLRSNQLSYNRTSDRAGRVGVTYGDGHFFASPFSTAQYEKGPDAWSDPFDISSMARSGGLEALHRLFGGGLAGRCDLFGNLAGCFLHRLGLLDGHFSLLAQESGLQFEEFGNGFDAEQRFHVRKRVLSVGAQRVDRLEAEFDGAGLRALEGRFDGLGRVFGGVLHLGIGFLGLGRTLFREITEGFRHLRRVEGSHGEYVVGFLGSHLIALLGCGPSSEAPRLRCPSYNRSFCALQHICATHNINPSGRNTRPWRRVNLDRCAGGRY